MLQTYVKSCTPNLNENKNSKCITIRNGSENYGSIGKILS